MITFIVIYIELREQMELNSMCAEREEGLKLTQEEEKENLPTPHQNSEKLSLACMTE